MVERYISLVRSYPLWTSAVQVALLSTFGEILAARFRRGEWYFFTPGVHRLMFKMLAWGFLGIVLEYAFVGFGGFVDTIVKRGIWFQLAGSSVFFRGFSVSLFLNLLFGPVLVLFHRLCDNAIERKPMAWKSLQSAWWSAIWFWIPVHSVTFSLPPEFQIGFAAFWSMVAGLILGYFAHTKEAA